MFGSTVRIEICWKVGFRRTKKSSSATMLPSFWMSSPRIIEPMVLMPTACKRIEDRVRAGAFRLLQLREFRLDADPDRVEAVEQQFLRLVLADRADRSEGEEVQLPEPELRVLADQRAERVHAVLVVEEVLVVDVDRARERVHPPVAPHAVVELLFVEHRQEAALGIEAGHAERAPLDAPRPASSAPTVPRLPVREPRQAGPLCGR